MHTSHDLIVSVEFFTNCPTPLPLVSLMSPSCLGTKSQCEGREINGHQISDVRCVAENGLVQISQVKKLKVQTARIIYPLTHSCIHPLVILSLIHLSKTFTECLYVPEMVWGARNTEVEDETQTVLDSMVSRNPVVYHKTMEEVL